MKKHYHKQAIKTILKKEPGTRLQGKEVRARAEQ
jgi:hypothetical protein